MVKRMSRDGQESERRIKRWSRGAQDIVDERSSLWKSKITVFNEFIKGFLRCAGILKTHLRNISAKCNFFIIIESVFLEILCYICLMFDISRVF